MSHNADNEMQPLSGWALFFGALCLAMANFLAILDTTIANVSVSNIAGSLGTSTSQGTPLMRSQRRFRYLLRVGWLRDLALFESLSPVFYYSVFFHYSVV